MAELLSGNYDEISQDVSFTCSQMTLSLGLCIQMCESFREFIGFGYHLVNFHRAGKEQIVSGC